MMRCVFDDICRLRELNTLTGQVESVVKLRGLDIDAIQQHYTQKKGKLRKTNKQDRRFKTRAKAQTFNSNQQYEKDTKSNSRFWFYHRSSVVNTHTEFGTKRLVGS
ncbi:hypothetical protein YC2023_103310 [Brassica napus]